MKLKKILVYPGDSALGLEIINSLKYNKDIILYSAGSIHLKIDKPFHKKHFIIPSILEENGIDALNKIIEQNGIDFIYPSDDIINIKLMENREKIPTNIISSPLNTLLITSSKSRSSIAFKDIISGSKLKIKELCAKEYIVGCISDRERGLIFCGGMDKVEIINRNSYKIKLIINNDFNDYTKKILNKVNIYGAWSFQIKINKEKEFELVRITPRVDLKTIFFRILGINFPLLSIYECERDNFQILYNNYEIEFYYAQIKKFKIPISYKTIYIDLDDTIIIKNALNTQIIDFLNQCIKNSKRILLITKHRDDIEKTLEKYNVPKNIFQKIIHLDENDEKFDYISEKDSIFIDDSYHERKKISERIGISVFDVSMIEGLLKI